MTDIPRLLADKAALEAQIQAQKPAAVARVVALMEELGLTWRDMGVEPMGRAKAKTKRKVKFRDEQGNTWSGVGQRPRWLQARIQAGASLEQFLIKD